MTNLDLLIQNFECVYNEFKKQKFIHVDDLFTWIMCNGALCGICAFAKRYGYDIPDELNQKSYICNTPGQIIKFYYFDRDRMQEILSDIIASFEIRLAALNKIRNERLK